MPDPVLLFGVGELVEVQDDFPIGLGLFVLGQGGATPKAAHVLLIAPEVVVELAVLGYVRNALLGIEDGKEPLPDRFELGRGFELAGADGVLLL